MEHGLTREINPTKIGRGTASQEVFGALRSPHHAHTR